MEVSISRFVNEITSQLYLFVCLAENLWVNTMLIASVCAGVLLVPVSVFLIASSVCCDWLKG